MADIVPQQKRSRMMAGIHGKDTRPEMAIRKALHALGYRYRIHDRRLPGRPDMVFPRYKAVIEINGCFWHRHDCHLFKWPSTRKEFWKQKLNQNRERDARNHKTLKDTGWRVLTIWECAMKGRTRLPMEYVVHISAYWLDKGQEDMEIEGVLRRRK